MNLELIQNRIMKNLTEMGLFIHEMPSKDTADIYLSANKKGFRFFNDFRSTHFVMDRNGDVICIGDLMGINAQLNNKKRKLTQQQTEL